MDVPCEENLSLAGFKSELMECVSNEGSPGVASHAVAPLASSVSFQVCRPLPRARSPLTALACAGPLVPLAEWRLFDALHYSTLVPIKADTVCCRSLALPCRSFSCSFNEAVRRCTFRHRAREVHA